MGALLLIIFHAVVFEDTDKNPIIYASLGTMNSANPKSRLSV
jgi:hypothetical protein